MGSIVAELASFCCCPQSAKVFRNLALLLLPSDRMVFIAIMRRTMRKATLALTASLIAGSAETISLNWINCGRFCRSMRRAYLISGKCRAWLMGRWMRSSHFIWTRAPVFFLAAISSAPPEIMWPYRLASSALRITSPICVVEIGVPPSSPIRSAVRAPSARTFSTALSRRVASSP